MPRPRISATGVSYTVHLPKELSDHVLRIACQEFETPSTVLRRLYRLGLRVELRRTASAEAGKRKAVAHVAGE
jgi:hypothetical protein